MGPGPGKTLPDQFKDQVATLKNEFQIDLHVMGIMDSKKMYRDHLGPDLLKWKELLDTHVVSAVMSKLFTTGAIVCVDAQSCIFCLDTLFELNKLPEETLAEILEACLLMDMAADIYDLTREAQSLQHAVSAFKDGIKLLKTGHAEEAALESYEKELEEAIIIDDDFVMDLAYVLKIWSQKLAFVSTEDAHNIQMAVKRVNAYLMELEFWSSTL